MTTTEQIYELRLLDREDLLVLVKSTDPRLSGIVGRLILSEYGPERSEKRVWRPGWIGFNMRMKLQFKNHLLRCSPTVSLRIEGDGWFYEVF